MTRVVTCPRRVLIRRAVSLSNLSAFRRSREKQTFYIISRSHSACTVLSAKKEEYFAETRTHATKEKESQNHVGRFFLDFVSLSFPRLIVAAEREYTSADCVSPKRVYLESGAQSHRGASVYNASSSTIPRAFTEAVNRRRQIPAIVSRASLETPRLAGLVRSCTCLVCRRNAPARKPAITDAELSILMSRAQCAQQTPFLRASQSRRWYEISGSESDAAVTQMKARRKHNR